MAPSLHTAAEGTDGRAPRQPRLALFLLLSVGVHAALLLGQGTATSRIDAGTNTEVIAVHLDGGNTGAARPTTASATPRQATQAPAAESAIVTPTPQSVAIRVDYGDSSAPRATGDEQQAKPAATEAAARVRALVLADLARYFYYPAIARARGWQGRVILAFQIDPDGLLQATRVAHTSGFAMLDEAALHSLRRVERIADAAAWLADRRLDLQIPVVYQLTDAR